MKKGKSMKKTEMNIKMYKENARIKRVLNESVKQLELMFNNKYQILVKNDYRLVCEDTTIFSADNVNELYRYIMTNIDYLVTNKWRALKNWEIKE